MPGRGARPRRARRAPARARLLAASILLLAAVVTLVIVARERGSSSTAAPVTRVGGAAARGTRTNAAPPAPAAVRGGRPAVGLRVLRLVDHSRSISAVSGSGGPRVITTFLRYPAVGPRGAVGLRDAPPLATSGPLPLVVFGHGFAVTPAPYSRLLDAWTRAGFVVAAPVFPLENADAPGGPDERDLVNQPGDMRFVISQLLLASGASGGPFSHLISPTRIAVAGQSDGGDTALATAYDPSVRDPRVRAAVILSGAVDPFARDFSFMSGGPALLATQGLQDTINPPGLTAHFFLRAGRPKYLLEMPGAGHQPPYTEPGRELRAVERATIGFLKQYLKGDAAAFASELATGTSGAGTVLQAYP